MHHVGQMVGAGVLAPCPTRRHMVPTQGEGAGRYPRASRGRAGVSQVIKYLEKNSDPGRQGGQRPSVSALVVNGDTLQRGNARVALFFWPNLLKCDSFLVLSGNTLEVTFPETRPKQ